MNLAPPFHQRFLHWPASLARLGLGVFAALLILSAVIPLTLPDGPLPTEKEEKAVAAKRGERNSEGYDRNSDLDLALYDTVIRRIKGGENYYDFIAEEHRKGNYPVTPAAAVRLPTLAYISVSIGEPGLKAAAGMLFVMLLLAWYFKLRCEKSALVIERIFASFIIFFSVIPMINPYFFVMHEIWAGMLMALSFGLHRPAEQGEDEAKGAWKAAWLAAALALAIRELVLPFVLLMCASAAYRRAWKEAAAWAALIIIFAIALAWHFSLVQAVTLPTDATGPSWIALRGLYGWLSNVASSSTLLLLPLWLSGPILMISLLGWAGRRSHTGSFGVLLFLGYGLAFMIASRPNNFYWGMVISPTMLLGLVFAPRSFAALVAASFPERANVLKKLC